MSTTKRLKLPLSTLLLSSSTTSNESNSIFNLIKSKFIFFESNLLLLSPISNLLFKIGINSTLILLINLITLTIGIKKLKIQNRKKFKIGLEILSLIEPILDTLRLLERLELGTGNSGLSKDGFNVSSEETHGENEEDEAKKTTTTINSELQHTLSFWLLYSLITLSESYFLPTSSPKSTSIPPAESIKSISIPTFLTSIYSNLYTQLTTSFLLPSTASSPSSSSKLSSKASRPFPEPSPFPSNSTLSSSNSFTSSSSSLPSSKFTSLPTSNSIKYQIFKLLILWISSRKGKDEISAQWIWSKMLFPIFKFVKSLSISGGSGSSTAIEGGESNKVVVGKKTVEIIIKSGSSTTTSKQDSPFSTPSSNRSSSSSSSSSSGGSTTSNTTISSSTPTNNKSLNKSKFISPTKSRIPHRITSSTSPHSTSPTFDQSGNRGTEGEIIWMIGERGERERNWD